MPAGEATELIGSVGDDAVRPVRAWLAVVGVGPVVMLIAAVALGVGFAPNLATGLGLTHQVRARVVSVIPVPGELNQNGRECDKNRITVTWGAHGDHRGVAELCQFAAGADPDAGATVKVWVLPGWDRVVVGSRTPDTMLAVFLLVLLVGSGWGVWWVVRQWLALARMRARSRTLPVLRASRGEIVSVRRGRRRVRVRFDDGGYRPIVLTMFAGTAGATLWSHYAVSPAGRSVRGRLRGPYLIRPAGGDTAGPVAVALGRSLRTSR